MPFTLTAAHEPAGDQGPAIDGLLKGLSDGLEYQTLLGITGSGKSFTLANVIAAWGRPTLILAPNKALAAQLFQEMRDLFPSHRVEYFVSYYDYYQPEAYVPASDTYIEKTSAINDEIDRLRHSATEAALTRPDTIIVASVSAIYGLGDPAGYRAQMLELAVGATIDREALLARLITMRYLRNDVEPTRGQFRVRGDAIEISPAHGGPIIRIELFGDQVERIGLLDSTTRGRLSEPTELLVAPASHYAADSARLETACTTISTELAERLTELRATNELVSAQRLEQRVRQDLDMLRETGWCAGVENYSRHIEGRPAGTRPWTLLNYLGAGFLLIVDESHVSVPQLGAARAGDRVRKQTLVDYGFRLPSALDNRPLGLDEVWELCLTQGSGVIFSSATPGPFELAASGHIVEQVIRPTGLVDPDVVVRPRAGAVADTLAEVMETVARGRRVLITTLTKRSAEDLTTWLAEQGVQARHLHSDVETLERIELLRNLRLGVYDVLVGINLLREGLDLPEVELVCILDADVAGFLRSERSLLQTIGRAARNADGRVILYADTVTPAMEAAITTTARRRARQEVYNAEHGITPATIVKPVHDVLAALALRPKAAPVPIAPGSGDGDLEAWCIELEARMLQAAEALLFEDAAALRDELAKVQAQLTGGFATLTDW